MVLYSPYFGKTWFYIIHFGVKNGTLYGQEERKWYGTLENIRSQLGHILKLWLGARKTQIASIKHRMKKSTLIRLIWITICTNERWTFWLWFCKKSSNGILAKNVRKREDNWVGSWVITLPEAKRPQEADKRKFFEVCHDFLGNVMALIISWGGVRPHGTTHTCTEITQVIYDERKQCQSFCKDMFVDWI